MMKKRKGSDSLSHELCAKSVETSNSKNIALYSQKFSNLPNSRIVIMITCFQSSKRLVYPKENQTIVKIRD